MTDIETIREALLYAAECAEFGVADEEGVDTEKALCLFDEMVKAEPAGTVFESFAADGKQIAYIESIFALSVGADVYTNPIACKPKEGIAEQEPVEFDDWPVYNEEAMGCGLEDRGITDCYEAMRYGWDEALEMASDRVLAFHSSLSRLERVITFSPPRGDPSIPPIGHPLRTLGEMLTHLLDDDKWNNCEPLLLRLWEMLSTEKPQEGMVMVRADDLRAVLLLDQTKDAEQRMDARNRLNAIAKEPPQ